MSVTIQILVSLQQQNPSNTLNLDLKCDLFVPKPAKSCQSLSSLDQVKQAYLQQSVPGVTARSYFTIHRVPRSLSSIPTARPNNEGCALLPVPLDYDIINMALYGALHCTHTQEGGVLPCWRACAHQTECVHYYTYFFAFNSGGK